MKNACLFIFYLMFLSFAACKNKEAHMLPGNIRIQLTKDLLSKLYLPLSTKKVYIDTTLKDEWYYSEDSTGEKPKMNDIHAILDIKLLQSIIRDSLNISDFVTTDRIIFSKVSEEWSKRFLAERSMVFFISHVYIGENGKLYIIEVNMICGRLCGSSVTYQIKTTDDGKMEIETIAHGIS